MIRKQPKVLEGFTKRQHMTRREIVLFNMLSKELRLEEAEPARGLILLNYILLSLQIRREFKKIAARAGTGDVKLFSSLVSQHSSLARSLGFLAKDSESDAADVLGIGDFLRGNDTTAVTI